MKHFILSGITAIAMCACADTAGADQGSATEQACTYTFSVDTDFGVLDDTTLYIGANTYAIPYGDYASSCTWEGLFQKFSGQHTVVLADTMLTREDIDGMEYEIIDECHIMFFVLIPEYNRNPPKQKLPMSLQGVTCRNKEYVTHI